MNNQQSTDIEYEYYDWNLIIKRLKFHRERLKLSQDEMKTLIQQKYNCGFMRLSDDKIMELGLLVNN